MKNKIAIAVAALVLASGTAYAAVRGSSCSDCCDEMRAHGEHQASTPAAAAAPQR